MLDVLALGARHGFDADHLAAIAELTAGERGGLVGFGAGLKYALGHALTIAVLGYAAGAAGIEVPSWLIGLTLLGLGAWASYRLVWSHTHEHEVGGRTVRHAHRHRHAIGVGMVHGLGGAPGVVLAGSRGPMALLVFTVGLLVANGTVGAFAGATSRILVLAWVSIVLGSAYGVVLVAGLT